LDVVLARLLVKLLKKSGLDVTGIDNDLEQIEAARTRAVHPHLRFIVMDATKLHFYDAEFDIVATSMVIHHMPGWEQAFSEMIRVLRPGGYLIYSDFMLPSWLAAIGRHLIPFVGFPSTKLIESLASGAGLTKVHCRVQSSDSTSSGSSAEIRQQCYAASRRAITLHVEVSLNITQCTFGI
jgi:ubiquinone/menaquinone biosynthesis C-methylase UbiE